MSFQQGGHRLYATGALHEYLNFHRPCCFAHERTDERGRTVRRYRPQDVMTPFEKLRSMPDAEACLRPGVTMQQLEDAAMRVTDNEMAELLLKERRKLFKPIMRSLQKAA